MNDSIDDRLRESLAAMSRPTDDHAEPTLVHRALDEVQSGATRVRAHGPASTDASMRWSSRVPTGLVATTLSVLLISAIVVAVLLPSRGSARSTTPESVAAMQRRANELERQMQPDDLGARLGRASSAPTMAYKSAPTVAAAELGASALMQADVAEEATFNRADMASRSAETADDTAAPEPARIVIRTGSCEIRVEDVSASQRTVEAMLRPDLGEYVAEATIDLERSRPIATLTVRIDASRFDEFVANLAGVGAVRSMNITAEDATDQLVDLDARLRNERHVESEVLGLLADRPDASLEDIVRVRRELAGVRESIERMDAQRESIVRRAAMSTMRIMLVGPSKYGMQDDRDRASFGARMGRAVSDGWRTCTSSAVWLAEVFVAGLMWWAIAGVLIWLAVRHYRWTSTWR